MPPELEEAFLADQQDHRAGHQVGTPEYAQMRERGRARRMLVKRLLEEQGLTTAEALLRLSVK